MNRANSASVTVNALNCLPPKVMDGGTSPFGNGKPSLVVLPQGRKQVQIGSDLLTYDSSRYLLTSVDLPTVTRVIEASEEAPCLALSLKLDISIVREFLAREEFQIPEAPPDTPAMSTGPVTPELLDAWRRLLDLLSTPENIPFLSGFIEREIIYRILRGPEAARLRAVATLGDQSHRTAKAIAWIKTNYARPLHIEELAEIAGMAVSTLHHHFRALTAMGPLQYQKQIRLQAARARMLADDVDAATVAFEVGYESASQFNREYGGCSASHLFVTSRPCVRRRLRDSNPWPRPAKCLNSLLIFHMMPSPLRR